MTRCTQEISYYNCKKNKYILRNVKTNVNLKIVIEKINIFRQKIIKEDNEIMKLLQRSSFLLYKWIYKKIYKIQENQMYNTNSLISNKTTNTLHTFNYKTSSIS